MSNFIFGRIILPSDSEVIPEPFWKSVEESVNVECGFGIRILKILSQPALEQMLAEARSHYSKNVQQLSFIVVGSSLDDVSDELLYKCQVTSGKHRHAQGISGLANCISILVDMIMLRSNSSLEMFFTEGYSHPDDFANFEVSLQEFRNLIVEKLDDENSLPSLHFCISPDKIAGIEKKGGEEKLIAERKGEPS